ncbi:DEAD/DEAH box helicase [Petrotoga sp. 9PWA.NaAc.5.4]|uniref:DEAD/DEAH box helicase n=1 Tax=Petrotoga sp. 9PWA.NaAc.5.4 TaxID=1434328 RepID=UPI000CC27D0A|nr:DEAD/DEAH box helicase [Petrotoga sp. 9PWA.NaAc.5.4]PNR96270.1 hypothetical protein X924_03075 [Petrotoga sp. 9PWA.NaAc.5.4]
MAGKYVFGKTWWGKKWVEALEKIDRDTNRLPRGRSYAKKGAVLDIKIQKNSKIVARVQGTRPVPYKEVISLTPFSEEEKEKIKKVLHDRIDLSAILLTGTLPQELFDITKEMGIKLFPEKWKDIGAYCSCPDWANPCKHLAAVFYIITDEIDKDPFLIFEMHGMKKDELIEIAKETEKSYDHIFTDDYHKESSEKIEKPELIDEIYDIQKVINLLPEEAYFYDGKSFKALLLEMYEKLREAVYKNNKINEELKPYFKETQIEVIYSLLNPNILLKGEPLKEINYQKQKEYYLVSSEDFFDLFDSMSLTETNGDNEKSLFLKNLFSFVYKLIDMKAFIPMPEKLNDEDFVIGYFPIEFNESITDNLNYLKSIVPEGIVKNEIGQYLKKEKVVEYLISQYLRYLINKYYEPKEKNKITEVFFKSKVYKALKFEEKRTFTSIKNYLEPLLLKQSKYQLVISIEELGQMLFNLSLDIYRKDSPFDTLKDIKSFFESQEDGKSEVLKQIATISKYAEFFGEFLKKKSPQISVTPEQLSEIMINAMPILKLLDVEILAPKALQKLLRPKLALKAKSKDSQLTYLSLSQLIKFDYTVLIGESEISFEEFMKLVQKTKGIVKIKENYVFLDPQEFEVMMQKVKKIKIDSDFDTLKVILTQEINGIPIILDNNIQKFLEELRKISPVRLPTTLNAELRNYQKEGFRWLYTNLKKGFNVCIADDMGLGKTVQVISVILKMKEEKALGEPVLVICPTTLVGNWYKECEKFAPTLKVSIYHGNYRTLEDTCDVIITTYSVVRNDIDYLKTKEFSILVIDEAQNIKNSDTKQSRATKSLKAQKRIAVTGTPIENRLSELWSLYDFLMPGYLGKKKYFLEIFAKPIERYNDAKVANKLQKLISPFMIRRLKTDKKIIQDLPEKFTYNEYVYLKPEQAALYKEIVEKAEEELENLQEYKGIQRKGLILKILTSLKQICNHPVNYTKKGKISAYESGKSERLLDLLQSILNNDEKAIIFTQYKEMGDILKQIIFEEMDIEPLFFHGELNRKMRDQLIEDFQTKHKYPIMILSLKVGGTGLNLTAANHVIHYDLWWNPAVENQATDRAFRIGQTKDVLVHRFITLNTFEEKINEMLEKKKELLDNIVLAGENWITKLSNEEIKELFKMGK